MGQRGSEEDQELAAIWREFKPLTHARIEAIREAARRSVGAPPGATSREAARAEAHTIAGSAAIFGMRECARLAREIEALLDRAGILEAEDVTRIESLADGLLATLSA